MAWFVFSRRSGAPPGVSYANWSTPDQNDIEAPPQDAKLSASKKLFNSPMQQSTVQVLTLLTPFLHGGSALHTAGAQWAVVC